MRRTKVANKLNVTFDYESESFVPVEDGEFVLINNGNEAIGPIVLPRSARFATRRDFYEFYQDYYHCAKPDQGEVYIIEPAAVAGTAEGWRLQAPGILEVLEDQPKKRASADATRHQVDRSAREKPGLSVATMKEESESPVSPCPHCGSIVETRYAFCWKCGNPLTPENEVSVSHWEKPSEIMPSAAIATEEEESTVQHDVGPVGSPMFSWALAKEPDRATSANGSLLKLMAIAVVGLLLLSLGLFVLTSSASRRASVTAAQPVTSNVQPDPSLAPTQEVKRDMVTEPTLQGAFVAGPEDDDLKKLRESRIAATASDRSAILQAFARAEKQYSNDYRFPYERAKLAIKGSESSSHDEAFNALSLAAEKAIKTGKAHEMLDGLDADKTDDFHKLSHGHREWTQLAEALKSKDTRLLSGKVRF